VECLSGIPGLAGATPIQNVGAYGRRCPTTVRTVKVIDRATLEMIDLLPSACVFGFATAFSGATPNAMSWRR